MHRYRFTDLLDSNTSLTKPRFVRLFALSMLLLIVLIPSCLYVFFVNINAKFVPFDWNIIHGEGWLFIPKQPIGTTIQPERWIPIIAGYLVFAIFGLGKDATTMYRGWINAIGIGRLFSKFGMGRFPNCQPFQEQLATDAGRDTEIRLDRIDIGARNLCFKPDVGPATI